MSFKLKQDFSNKYDLDALIKKYIEDKVFDTRTEKEVEVRFSTLNPKDISRTDYDRTIQKLLSLGFRSDNLNGEYLLRIQNEFTTQEGFETISNVRTEIQGLNIIQDYCKLENIEKLIEIHGTQNITFMRKDRIKDENGMPIYPVNNDEFKFRTSYQLESFISQGLINKIIDNWTQSKKTFRYLNRIRLYHEDLPVFADITIVKSGEREKKRPFRPIPHYSLQSSGVFTNLENYEIELELDNSRIGNNDIEKKEFSDHETVVQKLKIAIKYILTALQGSNYPISNTEQQGVLNSYLKLIYGKDKELPSKITPRNFIGPSSNTLQFKNIIPLSDDMKAPNIREDNYTVTDKADGERSLLFINDKGKLYFIDSNMKVKFTGCFTDQKALYNTLLDGEFIQHNKYGEIINLFACFDIYYLKGENKRNLPFVDSPDEDSEKSKKGRLTLLRQFLLTLKIKSITGNKILPIRTEVKFFEIASDSKNIFMCCNNLLKRINDPSYEYETDGLIFTPGRKELPPSNSRVTWDSSFKWKPSKFNTIDFLIETKKNETKTDDVGYIYSDGKSTTDNSDIKSYKTLILMVGFDEKQHGYMNPCSNIIEDKLPDKNQPADYKPLPFYPNNPFDDNAYICNVILKKDINGEPTMFTEENEVIEDNTIVEFRYEINNPDRFKWIPLRVRYDKTYQYRSKIVKNYGNDYRVANDNWHSIHYPITEEILKTGENIPDELSDDDVYYKKSDNVSQTKRLRDFHNLYVKSKLILGVSKIDDSLIDYAVGKAGDLPKWIRSKLSFVFGVDNSKDNIENKVDGACARWLNKKKDMNRLPYCFFTHGNSGLNIKNTDAIHSEKYKKITRAIFGDGPKDEQVIGKGVYKHYGVGKNGFNISSCQFALHYFFQSISILQKFLENVCECTKVNGYFVATCYDGKKIFDKLKSKKIDESVTINNQGKKVWEITKLYDKNEFKDDSTSVNYPINVYQESINKPAKEYLVNHNYLIRIMENYGFILLNEEECKDIGIPSSTGSFESLFYKMNDDVKNNVIKSSDLRSSESMKPYEKQISFLNRYYVFKKIREVNPKNVIIDDKFISRTQEEEKLTEFLEHQEEIRKIKKLPYKLKLKQITNIEFQ